MGGRELGPAGRQSWPDHGGARRTNLGQAIDADRALEGFKEGPRPRRLPDLDVPEPPPAGSRLAALVAYLRTRPGHAALSTAVAKGLGITNTHASVLLHQARAKHLVIRLDEAKPARWKLL